MPALANPAHEAYAWFRAQGHDPAEAYAAVGYKTRDRRSSGLRLDVDPHVAHRIQEYRQMVLDGTLPPQPPLPPRMKRGAGATNWKPEQLVQVLPSTSQMSPPDPRNLPAPVVPRGRELEEAHAPVDFTAPSVGWIRGELFRAIQDAKEAGDFKNVMTGFELMLASMAVSTKVPKAKDAVLPKGPEESKEAAPTQENETANDPVQREVTISVVHQFIGEMANGSGGKPTPKDITPKTIDGDSHEVDGDV